MIHHSQIGDFYWMTVSVYFLIEFYMGTVHTVAVHFRYSRYMRRLANEFLSRNPITMRYALRYRKMTRMTSHTYVQA